MSSNAITRAWFALLVLSAVSTLVAVGVSQGYLNETMVKAGGVAILVLGWIKARIILAQYLDLKCAPDWLRGFTGVLVAYTLLLMGLYLAAG